MRGKTREQVMRRIRQEPMTTVEMLCKCAAGIAVVTLIAVIGANSEKRNDQAEAHRPGHEASAPAPASAEAHRKQVFDERRERFGGARRAAGLAENTSRPGTAALP